MLKRQGRDAGFTLIELLMSIAILGILMSALVGLMFAAMSANNQTKSRLDGTRAEQFSAVYFGRDVQGAQGSDGLVAGVTARCGPGSAVLEIRGVSYDAGTLIQRVTVVSYVFSTTVVDGVVTGELRRRSCEADASPAPTYPLSPIDTKDGGAGTCSGRSDPGVQARPVRTDHDLGRSHLVAAGHRPAVHACRHEEDDDMTLTRGKHAADDEGASLVLALIFITAVSLVVGALLSYSSTGLRSGRVTGDAVQSTTDVAGALQTAINDVRNSEYFNNPASSLPCLDAGNTRTYPALSPSGERSR